MRITPLALSAVVVSTIAIGCFGSSSSAPPEPATGNPLDGGLETLDASMPPDGAIAPAGDGGGAPPAEADGEGGTVLPLASCATPTTIDTAHLGHNFASVATLGNGKYVTVWGETNGTTVFKARVFDGATLQPEQTIDAQDEAGIVRADGQGNAYVAWRTGLAVLSPATGLFGTPTPLPLMSSFLSDVALGTFKAGGALVFFGGYDSDAGGARSVLSTRYDPGSGTWSPAEGREAGTLNTPHVATNASGKAVAGWLGASSNGATAFSIETFDGATWTAPVHSMVGTGTLGAGPDGFDIAAYSNGDALLIYPEQINGMSRAIEVQRFRTATQQWDAPETIETASPGSQTLLAIDESDRVTAVYTDDVTENRAVVRRNLGAGWTPAIDLGRTSSSVFALDPSDNPVVVLTPVDVPPTLRRCAADGTTWDGPTVTGFTAASPNSSTENTLGFDGAGHPVLVEPDVMQSQLLVRLTVCQ